MKTHIDSVSFGKITVNGETYDHDILIRLNGKVKKRKKKLSREVYGTSHVISMAEAEHVYEKNADRLVIGAGHEGMVILSTEADDFFKVNHCSVILAPTPAALQEYNKSEGNTIGLFHITC